MQDDNRPQRIDLVVLLLLCPLLLTYCLGAPFLPFDDDKHVMLDVVSGKATISTRV